jgi:glycosyltransferase involved in cell wall biosynthesis
MKINFLMASGFSLTGGDRVIAIHADALARKGHEVEVVTTTPPEPRLRDHLRSLKSGNGLAKTWKPGPSHFDYDTFVSRRVYGTRTLTDHDIADADVTIATWWETGEWLQALSPSKGTKVFFVQGYEAFDNQSTERVNAVWRMPFHKIIISDWLKGLAADRFGDTDVSLVKNSVDTQLFNAPPRDRNGVPTVGMLYSKFPLKGCALSLAALRRVRDEFPNLTLMTFGAVPTAGDPVPLPDWASFESSPPQQRIAEIYRSCDVWICGSDNEGFGLPILEAMACRTPVASTPVGAVTDLVQQGVNGYYTSTRDEAELAEAVCKILRRPPSEWRLMSEAAWATARRHTWSDAADLFEKALYYAIEKDKA